MFFLLSTVIALVPLALAPGLFLYFDVTPKAVVLLFGTAAVVAFGRPTSGLRALAAHRAGRLFLACVVAQALCLVASTILSTNFAVSVAGTNWRRFGLVTQLALLLFLALLAAELVQKPALLGHLLRVASLCGILAALYAVVQYLGYDPLLDPVSYSFGLDPNRIRRPPGPLGYASYLANYLAPVMFLSFVVAARDRSLVWRAVGLLGTILSVVGILLTGTRGAFLGVLVGAVILAWPLRSSIRPRHLLPPAAITAGLVALSLSPQGLWFRNRVVQMFQDARGGPRLWLWWDSLGMARGRWLAGYGLETFSTEFPRFQSLALAQRYPDFYHESPHNAFLDAWLSQGAPGLLILLGFLISGFWAFRTARRSQPFLAAGLCAALGAIIVSHQFTCFVIPTALYFNLALASVLAAGSPPVVASAQRPRLIRRASWVVGALLAFSALQLFQADRALASVERYLKAGRLEEATADYDLARAWQPAGFTSDLWYSRHLFFTGQKLGRTAEVLPETMDAAQRAVRRAEDRHNAYYHLALLYAAQGDRARTEEHLRGSLHWAPLWYKPYVVLAEVLRSSGRTSEAAAADSKAIALGGRQAVLQ